VSEIRGAAHARDRRFGLVASRFNQVVVTRLVDGTMSCLRAKGVAEDDVTLAWVPGAFELPLVARTMASSGAYDAVICLGAVIRGETPHFEHVAGQAAEGIRRAAEDSGIPVVFGVLTTNTFEQAMERAGGAHGNKGWDAAMAAMEMVSVMSSLPIAGPIGGGAR
jgi:6,7-dimethyl-8-ribityllumazine synthase